MAITVLGNHGPAFQNRGGPQGVSRVGKPTSVGYVSVTGDAGDIFVLGLSDFVISDLNQGVFFQAPNGVGLEFTLGEISAAVSDNPNVRDSVPWGNALSVTGNDIVESQIIFTAVKITFTAKGTLYIGAR